MDVPIHTSINYGSWHISVEFNSCIINITNFCRLWIILIAFHFISYLIFFSFLKSGIHKMNLKCCLCYYLGSSFLSCSRFLTNLLQSTIAKVASFALLYLQYSPTRSCRINSIGLIKLSRICISIIFVSLENVSFEVNCRLSFWVEGTKASLLIRHISILLNICLEHGYTPAVFIQWKLYLILHLFFIVSHRCLNIVMSEIPIMIILVIILIMWIWIKQIK